MLVIHSASFAGRLGACSGGGVKLALDMTFMDKRSKMALEFNFGDPLSGAKALGTLLLPK